MSKDSTFQLTEKAVGAVDNADSSTQKRVFLDAATKKVSTKDSAGAVEPLGGGAADTVDDQTLQTPTGAVATIATYSTLADSKAISLKTTVWARQSGGVAGTVGDSAKFVVECLFERSSGSVVVSKDENFISIYKDPAVAAWNVTFTITSQDINVRVQGETNKTVEWRCQLEVSEHG